MRDQPLEQPNAQTLPLVIGLDVNVAEPGDRGVIRDHAGKTDLYLRGIDAKAEGRPDGPSQGFCRGATPPLAGLQRRQDAVRL